jgi:NhaP-type Na+/H+ or K+/H+ antiporter
MLTATLALLGLVLVAMSLAERGVRRMPLSPAAVYLVVGGVVGALAQPVTLGDWLRHAPALAVATEFAVLISLFTVGLRLRVPPTWQAWRVAALLASVGMLATIALAAAAAAWLFGLGLAAALLLATILAPTDPVLASEVQIQGESDRDAVRLSLTAEGGLNDGTALPVTMLALGLLGLHTLGPLGGRWFALDLVWPIGGGLLIGWCFGRLLGRMVHALLKRGHAIEWDELLYLGTIALGFAIARLSATSAFLVVFAAGLALFHGGAPASAGGRTGVMSERLVAFGHRCERLIEVSMVMLLGAALASAPLDARVAAFALLFVFVVRPASVWLVVRKRELPVLQRRLVAWFGVRGVGSLFYLAFVLAQGVTEPLAATLVSACLWTIALSIVVHGVSATPLMAWHQARRARSAGRRAPRSLP